ncbi:MAG: endolytic transglycosylase MltG, partial [bacterium]
MPKGSSALELLRRSAAIQRLVIAREWEKRAQDLPYRSPYEALIVASIVEKETQYSGDREKVAAVFTNRMRVGMPLQADPTVIYGLGKEFAGDITRKHLKKDTPYNT